MVKVKRKEESVKEKSLQKEKALNMALSHIQKEFGQGAIMKLGQDFRLDVSSIPTGSLSLDLALGIGGVPKGRIIEIFGPESSGKTAYPNRSQSAGDRRRHFRNDCSPGHG